jgi:hypothetical protein
MNNSLLWNSPERVEHTSAYRQRGADPFRAKAIRNAGAAQRRPGSARLTVPYRNGLPAARAHRARGLPPLRQSRSASASRGIQLGRRRGLAEFLNGYDTIQDFLLQRLALRGRIEDIRKQHRRGRDLAGQGIERPLAAHGARLPDTGTTPPARTRQHQRGSVPPTADRFSMTTPFAWSRHPERRKGWRTVCGLADRAKRNRRTLRFPSHRRQKTAAELHKKVRHKKTPTFVQRRVRFADFEPLNPVAELAATRGLFAWWPAASRVRICPVRGRRKQRDKHKLQALH